MRDEVVGEDRIEALQIRRAIREEHGTEPGHIGGMEQTLERSEVERRVAGAGYAKDIAEVECPNFSVILCSSNK